MKSTPEMRARARELASPPRDDFDRAVLAVLDDVDVRPRQGEGESMSAVVKLSDQAIEALRLASMEVDQLRASNAELVAVLQEYVDARTCDCSELSGCGEAARQARARAAITRAKGQA